MICNAYEQTMCGMPRYTLCLECPSAVCCVTRCTVCGMMCAQLHMVCDVPICIVCGMLYAQLHMECDMSMCMVCLASVWFLEAYFFSLDVSWIVPNCPGDITKLTRTPELHTFTRPTTARSLQFRGQSLNGSSWQRQSGEKY